jgi:hypothetical protein
VGLALGGGYNSWYLSRVSEWGYFTYRDRHLRLSGSSWIFGGDPRG